MDPAGAYEVLQDFLVFETSGQWDFPVASVHLDIVPGLIASAPSVFVVLVVPVFAAAVFAAPLIPDVFDVVAHYIADSDHLKVSLNGHLVD